jgi:hypothetical protein
MIQSHLSCWLDDPGQGQQDSHPHYGGWSSAGYCCLIPLGLVKSPRADEAAMWRVGSVISLTRDSGLGQLERFFGLRPRDSHPEPSR